MVLIGGSGKHMAWNQLISHGDAVIDYTILVVAHLIGCHLFIAFGNIKDRNFIELTSVLDIKILWPNFIKPLLFPFTILVSHPKLIAPNQAVRIVKTLSY